MMAKKNMDSRSIKNKKKSKIRKTVVYKQILSARIDIDMAHPYIILSVFIFQDFSLWLFYSLLLLAVWFSILFFLVFMKKMRCETICDMELGKTQCFINWKNSWEILHVLCCVRIGVAIMTT